jgi:hypothetical protein
MNAVVVVVAVVLVVSVLIATMLFLRSVPTSPKQGTGAVWAAFGDSATIVALRVSTRGRSG